MATASNPNCFDEEIVVIGKRPVTSEFDMLPMAPFLKTGGGATVNYSRHRECVSFLRYS